MVQPPDPCIKKSCKTAEGGMEANPFGKEQHQQVQGSRGTFYKFAKLFEFSEELQKHCFPVQQIMAE